MIPTDATATVLRELPDAQIVGVVREFFDRVFSAVPYDALQPHFGAASGLAALTQLDPTALRRELPAGPSAQLARALLGAAARDAALEPLVRESIDTVRRSDLLVVDCVVSVGLIVNLTLLLASTRLHIAKDAEGRITWSVTKETASPALVKAVVEPVVKAVAQVLS